MVHLPKQPPPQVLEVFHVCLTDFPQKQALEARHPLAVVSTHLCEQPVRFSTAARPAVTHSRWPVRFIALPGGSGGQELPWLKERVRKNEHSDLLFRAARLLSVN
jgi:hypothetical protein